MTPGCSGQLMASSDGVEMPGTAAVQEEREMTGSVYSDAGPFVGLGHVREGSIAVPGLVAEAVRAMGGENGDDAAPVLANAGCSFLSIGP